MSTITPPPTNENTSASSSSSSSDQQILSTESTQTRSPLDVSVKTSSSDPIGLAVQVKNIDGEKYDEAFQCNRQPKSISYHEIHNKYTIRRYRHVESKVGQYIANIRAEGQKRRSKFKTMPISIVQQEPDQLEDPSLRQSTTYFNVHNGSNATNRSESSDDALNSADLIDKSTYNQLFDEKEYLETRLKEKSSENFRLRRNVDYLRIELTSCQDRLKRMSSSSINSNLSNYSNVMGYSYSGVEAFVQCRQHTTTATRATQTDDPAFLLTTPILVTGNVLRQRSNSNSSARDSMRMKNFNSSDDGFGSSEMRSRKLKSSKNPSESFSSSDATSELSPSSPSSSRLPPPGRKRRQSAQNSIQTANYATPTMLNDSDSSINDLDAADNIRTTVFVNGTSNHSIKRHTSLSQRFKCLIRRCTRCADPNNTTENQCERFNNTACIVSTAL